MVLLPAVLLVSCSNPAKPESDGTITFSITRELRDTLIQARNDEMQLLEEVSPEQTEQPSYSRLADLTSSSGLYSARALTSNEISALRLEITLSGGYEASKTLTVAEGNAVSFNNVPIGTKIYVQATAYRKETQADGTEKQVIYYAGKSAETSIKAGINKINLALQKMGTLFISVSVNNALNDLKLSYKTSDTNIVFSTASKPNTNNTESVDVAGNAESGGKYIWEVDGIVQDTTSSEFTLKTSDLKPGTYEISVTHGTRSAFATVSY